MDNDRLAAALMAVCNRSTASNPVAWHRLHSAGLTVEHLTKVASGPGWIGEKPHFDLAPDKDGAIWRYLESKSDQPDTAERDDEVKG